MIRAGKESATAQTLLMAAAFVAIAGAARAQDGADFEAYLAEMNDPSPDYVAVSNHFRHAESAACGPDGCVLVGPTDDLAACQRWAAAYNTVDPYDYTRCIEVVE